MRKRNKIKVEEIEQLMCKTLSDLKEFKEQDQSWLLGYQSALLRLNGYLKEAQKYGKVLH